jgi:hypothetical protein
MGKGTRCAIVARAYPKNCYTGAIVNGNLRKFCEQQSDVLQWDESNKNYILTHGVRGVDWRFYKHPLPEHVFDLYFNVWCGMWFDI